MKRFFTPSIGIAVCLLSLLSTKAAMAAAYCTPSYSHGCGATGFNTDINTFTLTGANATSINDVNTGCAAGAYQDNHLTMSVTMQTGSNYTIQVNTNSLTPPASFEVFIDFNDDGDFNDANESVGGSANVGNTLTSVSISIPVAANPGSHRMRALISLTVTYPGLPTCPQFPPDVAVGEAHDYTAVIVSPTVVASVSNQSAFNAYPNPASDVLSLEGIPAAGQVEIIDMAGRVISTNNVTATTAQFSISDLSAGTYFVKFSNSSYTEVIKINKQ